jgi:peptidase E
MNLILTSDFPRSAPSAVIDRLRAHHASPRIAWIAPDTPGGLTHFDLARERFAALGFDQLEHCDIDQDKDEVQLAYLYEFDIVYLSGGDPVLFRYNMLRAGLGGRLRQAASAGRLIVAASGGAMLLTPNVSLHRLLSEPLDTVMETRGRFDTLGAVPYEVLPHINRSEPEFLERVREYSARIAHDIIGIADGGAVFPAAGGSFAHAGEVVRFHRGERQPVR